MATIAVDGRPVKSGPVEGTPPGFELAQEPADKPRRKVPPRGPGRPHYGPPGPAKLIVRYTRSDLDAAPPAVARIFDEVRKLTTRALDCWPSNAYFERVTGYARRTVQEALRWLIAHGILGRELFRDAFDRTTRTIVALFRIGRGGAIEVPAPAVKSLEAVACAPPGGAEKCASERREMRQEAQTNAPRIEVFESSEANVNVASARGDREAALDGCGGGAVDAAVPEPAEPARPPNVVSEAATRAAPTLLPDALAANLDAAAQMLAFPRLGRSIYPASNLARAWWLLQEHAPTRIPDHWRDDPPNRPDAAELVIEPAAVPEVPQVPAPRPLGSLTVEMLALGLPTIKDPARREQAKAVLVDKVATELRDDHSKGWLRDWIELIGRGPDQLRPELFLVGFKKAKKVVPNKKFERPGSLLNNHLQAKSPVRPAPKENRS